jgi:hypothetical protein
MNTLKFPRFAQNILAKRRKARARFMLSKVNTRDRMRVIDIGCGIDGRSFEEHIPEDWQITGIDVLPEENIKHTHPNFTYVRQDAQDLSRFEDRSFDLAVSVGMLEHVTDRRAFRKLVAETRRVAKQYVFIVPYKYCWIEPHYGVPFFPLFPRSLQNAMIKTLNLSGHSKAVRDDPNFLDRQVMWLSNEEYRREFEDCTIFLTPTKETIAIVRKCELSEEPAGTATAESGRAPQKDRGDPRTAAPLQYP